MLDADPRRSSTIRRRFYAALAVLIAGVAVAGFWPTYWGLASPARSTSTVLHLHTGVFTAWLLLLITHASLVRRGRTDLRQKL